MKEPKKGKNQSESEKPKEKRLADKAGVGQSFEGEKIKLRDVEGEEVIVVDFRFGQSTYQPGKEFLTLQLEVEGELKVANCGGVVLVAAFHRLDKEKDLPDKAVFKKVASAESGRSYWTME